ncbi:site-specific integrase [Micromonospora sp. NBC_00362]|uniref:tyrosine-type recombinase/integrase n=1 Tax=Micromonospora sp. NBC_00362 TaxID=2975975 RepID=UPI002253F715|nr:site-specific integrase [Micromonospora sp. NBC_00362]MCX5119251.1 site-specific integrase [Micromonospora sp. NBC_00362]
MSPRLPYPTIKQGDDGWWHAYVTVGSKPNGRADQRHVRRKTKDATVARVDELLAQRRSGAVTKAGRAPTVQSWMETYLTDVAPRRCNPATLYDYRSKCRNWIYPHLGKTRLDKLKPDQLDAMYLAMERQGKASSHALKVHRIMTRALEVALRRGMVARNVAKLIDAPSGRSPKMAFLTEPEAAKVLVAAAELRNSARWSVALALGLRQGEALGLRWAHVDLGIGHMEIPKQLRRRIYEHGCGGTCDRKRGADCPQRSEGGLQLVDPKGKSERTLPIPAPLVEKLRAHRAAQDAERAAAGEWWVEGDFVFAQNDGRPLDPRQDYQVWRDLLDTAGVKRVRLHDARHTAATLMVAQGVDLHVVKDVLGHTDIRTTQGYAKVVSELTREATDRMGRLLLGGS